jgi:hypothetical protein
MSTDLAALKQLKDNQKDANERLDRRYVLLEQLVTEQRRTNQLLEWIGQRTGPSAAS